MLLIQNSFKLYSPAPYSPTPYVSLVMHRKLFLKLSQGRLHVLVLTGLLVLHHQSNIHAQTDFIQTNQNSQKNRLCILNFSYL